MIITALKAQNYRSFASKVEYFPREGINIIVGENNVGKSNLLKILPDIIESLSNLNINNPQSYQNNDNDIFLECECKLNDEDIDFLLPLFSLTTAYKEEFEKIFGTTIEIKYTFSKVNGQSMKIKMNEYVFNDNIITLEKHLDSGYSVDAWETVTRQVINSNDSLSEKFLDMYHIDEDSGSHRAFQSRKPFREYFAKLFEAKSIIFPEFRERSTTQIKEGLFSSPQGDQVASVLHNLKNGDMKNRRKFKDIQDHFKEIFPNLHLDVRQGEIVVVKAGEHEESLDFIGAGIVEIIILLTHLIGIKGHIIILDEPELHLHPHAKRLVSELIKEASKDNQIISVTHSTHFIFTERLYQITLIREEEGISKLTNMQKGILTDDEFIKIQRLTDSEKKEFFFSRAVLLVEGDTEKGAIPIFAKNFGFNLDLHNISVISLDGHDFSLFSKLLNGFKIQHVVMLDFDTLENIVASITFNGQKIKTSSLIRQLDDLGLLSETEKRIIQECESEIVTKNKDKSIYNQNTIQKLIPIIENHNFIHLLSTDFEGLFSTTEHKNIMRDAKREFKKNKVLVGIHFAENVEMPKEIYYGLGKLGEIVDVPFEHYDL